MGEGLNQMFREVSSSSSRGAEDLAETSSVSGDSEDVTKNSDPLRDFSSLVSQLPVRKGLSKFYKGKSESFSSFSDVRCVEDLAKKENLQTFPYPYKGKILKPCRKSYADGFDQSHNTMTNGGAAAAAPKYQKEASRGIDCASSIATASSYFSTARPPPIPMQKNI